MSQYASIALFDLDHTLLMGNSSFSFGKHLYRRGFFSILLMLLMTGLYGLYWIRLLSIRRLHERIFQCLFKGKSRALFIDEAILFVRSNLRDMLYQPAVKELKLALTKGDFVAILSSGPDFLVEIIAKELGLLHWQGTVYAVDSLGDFSHISQFMLGEDKAAYSYHCAKRLQIDASQVTAYDEKCWSTGCRATR